MCFLIADTHFMASFRLEFWAIVDLDVILGDKIAKLFKANTEIDNELPYSEYFEYFRPDYSLKPNIINNRVSGHDK